MLPCVFSRLFGGGAGPGRHAPPRVVHGFTLHIVLRLRSGTNPQNTHHSSFYALAAQPAPTMPDGCAIFLPQEKNAFFARESGVRVGQSRRQDTLVISSSTSQAHRTRARGPRAKKCRFIRGARAREMTDQMLARTDVSFFTDKPHAHLLFNYLYFILVTRKRNSAAVLSTKRRLVEV